MAMLQEDRAAAAAAERQKAYLDAYQRAAQKAHPEASTKMRYGNFAPSREDYPATPKAYGVKGLTGIERRDMTKALGLDPDFARRLLWLSRDFEDEFGQPITMTDGYRSLDAQRRLAMQKPGLAATPGRSVHGIAKAADLAINGQPITPEAARWLRANAYRYGMFFPLKDEDWHVQDIPPEDSWR